MVITNVPDGEGSMSILVKSEGVTFWVAPSNAVSKEGELGSSKLWYPSASDTSRVLYDIVQPIAGAVVINFEMLQSVIDARKQADLEQAELEGAPELIGCFCKMVFRGWGNNPAPVTSEGRACDSCNSFVVMPARFAAFASRATDE
eukprot:m.134237 g.134237  ORF g.134237 m.134237 type:complete len:146 (+) comp22528_c0_seq3:388-825(+)